jgi:gluconate:H+ symporter, GntP family
VFFSQKARDALEFSIAARQISPSFRESVRARRLARRRTEARHVSHTDIQLLATAFGGVLLLIGLIVSRLRLHPLIALLVVSIAVGLVSGMDVRRMADVIVEGAGGVLGDVGLIVALGAMLGKVLAQCGVTESLAEALVKRASGQGLPWALALAAFVIGVPMFFEVGLVVLLPLIFSVARKIEQETPGAGSPYVLLGAPVIAALSAMHGMVPPHPGPLAALATLKAPVAPAMIYGFVAAFPAIALGGPMYGRWIAPRMTVRPDETLLDQFSDGSVAANGRPRRAEIGPGLGLFAALLPAILMLANTLAELLTPKDSAVSTIAAFLGAPIIAMLVSVIFACVLALVCGGESGEGLRKLLDASLKPIVGILLIIAGGGAFKQVLVKAHVGDAIVHLAEHFTLPPLVLGWLIAMMLSVATGSATVGIVGAAGLLAPLASSDPSLNLPLLAIAIGSGSLFFNYANHAGFWLVKEAFGMTLGEATRTISIIQSIVALIGLAMAMLLNLLPPLPL